jgi:hypothetical protein
MKSNNDLHSNVKQILAVNAVALGATGAITGAIIDRQGYGGVQFLIAYGSITTTGTVVTAVLKEGDVTGTLTSVADTDLLGTETLASLAAGARTAGTGKEVVKRLGYKGTKRYVQLTLNGTGTTSVGIVQSSAVMFDPAIVPISNP